MARVQVLVWSCLVGLALAPLEGRSSTAAPDRAHVSRAVTIENMEFTPSQLTVHAGDRVVFSNKDLFPHTVTADDGSFDSHSIAPNATWTYRPKQAGAHAYKCSFHPTMTGKIIVQ